MTSPSKDATEMNKSITTLLLLSCCFMSQHASANERPPEGEPPSFDEMDQNGDGELQQDELRGPLVRDFDQLDSDQSGGLSQQELPPPPPRRQQ